MKCERPFCLQTLSLLGAGWFLVALFAGETGLLGSLPPAAVPGVIAALTGVLLGAFGGIRSFRDAVNRWPLRALLAVHLSRFVGIYFLILSARGELDPRFAVPAGYGDIAVAIGAVLLLAFPAPRWLLLGWNTLGLIEILLVVARAASLRFHDPSALEALTRLPLSFLPTMVVPLIIASHVVLYLRTGTPALKSSPDPAVVEVGTV